MMPWLAAHATCTAPVSGSGKVKMYSLAATGVRPVAGVLLINRSTAPTPETGSLKSTVMAESERTVAPLPGDRPATVGAVLSTKLYDQVAPGPIALNRFGGRAWSAMLWPG